MHVPRGRDCGRGGRGLRTRAPQGTGCPGRCLGGTWTPVPKGHMPVGFQGTDPSCHLPSCRNWGYPGARDASACLRPPSRTWSPAPGLPVRSQYAGSLGYLPRQVSESQDMAPPGLARRAMVIQLLPPPRSLGPPAAPHNCFQKLLQSLLGRTAPQAARIWGVQVSRGGVYSQLLAVQGALEGRTS